METALVHTPAVPTAPVVERRRTSAALHRGTVLVERRRPTPVFVLEADDLHAVDADRLLADALDHSDDRARSGCGTRALRAATDASALAGEVAELIDQAALAAHVLRPSATEQLA